MLRDAFREAFHAAHWPIPKTLRREVERFLLCGDVRYGFVEVRCNECSESRLVAFSCKSRGLCPSCSTRAAIETAENLTEVLPYVSHRQWTLSIPYALRFSVVKRPGILKRMEGRLVRAIWRWQRLEARRLGFKTQDVTGGAVCFWQWFGSSLQLTPHLHVLVPEAQWRKGDAAPIGLPAPSDDDVVGILKRVLTLTAKDLADMEMAMPETEYEESQCQHSQERLPLAVGHNFRKRRTASFNGFSLHADTAVHANDRDGLKRLCRYGARGPVSDCRLTRLEDGRYQYVPKGKEGVLLVLSAEELVRRLLVLVPPPKRHLTSFHGAYAPNSSLREALIPRAVEASIEAEGPVGPLVRGPSVVTVGAPAEAVKGRRRLPKPPRLDWQTLHRRTFGHDVLQCPCGGRRTIRALHSTPNAAQRRLKQLGLRILPSGRALPDKTAPPRQTSLAF